LFEKIDIEAHGIFLLSDEAIIIHQSTLLRSGTRPSLRCLFIKNLYCFYVSHFLSANSKRTPTVVFELLVTACSKKVERQKALFDHLDLCVLILLTIAIQPNKK